MRAAGSLARGLRRRGASPASDSNARAIHADTVPPGSRWPSDRPPERRAPVRFGLASPLRSLGTRWHLSVSPTLLRSYTTGQVRRKEKGCPYISWLKTFECNPVEEG